MRATFEDVSASSQFLREALPQVPDVVVILGSGWGDFAQQLVQPIVIPYQEIPHFAASTAPGHAGKLVCGKFAGKYLAVMQGRFHYYEGYTMAEITFPIMVFHALGVGRLIVTNAAGGLNPAFQPGDLMLITDHINFFGCNPLRGQNDSRFGPRFPDMTDCYSVHWRQQAMAIAKGLGISLREGIYVGNGGPSFETPAEVRLFRQWGGDAVGMSTVPEVIMANYLGMDVLGISCITNMAAGMTGAKISSEEVNETAAKAAQDINCLLTGIVAGLS